MPPVRTPEKVVGPLGTSDRRVTGMARAGCPVAVSTSDPDVSPGVLGVDTDSVTGSVAPGPMVSVGELTVPNDW